MPRAGLAGFRGVSAAGDGTAAVHGIGSSGVGAAVALLPGLCSCSCSPPYSRS